MAEYIEREALIAEIDDRISYIGFASPYQDDIILMLEGMARVRDIVEDFHAADVVEVVRCKDCKHYRNTDCGYMCGFWEDWLPTEDDDFCSYGERRGEE